MSLGYYPGTEPNRGMAPPVANVSTPPRPEPVKPSGPMYGISPNQKYLFVNGYEVPTDNAAALAQSQQFLNHPAKPMPYGIHTITPESYQNFITAATTPNTTAGGLAKSVGMGAMSLVGAVPKFIADVGMIPVNMGRDPAKGEAPIPPAPNLGTALGNKWGMGTQSLGDQAAINTTQSLQNASITDIPQLSQAFHEASAGGIAHFGAQGIGSIAPTILTSLIATPLAGAAIGALGAGGSNEQQAYEQLMAKPEAEWMLNPDYIKLLQQKVSPEVAKATLASQGGMVAGLMSAPVGAADAFLPGVGGAFEKAGSGIINPFKRKAAQLIAGSTFEGTQETAEGMAQNVGSNIGSGANDNIMQGSAGNALGGLLAGGPVSATFGHGYVAPEQTLPPPTPPTMGPTTDMFSGQATMPTEPPAPPPVAGSTTDMFSGEATTPPTPPPAGQGQLDLQPAGSIDMLSMSLPLHGDVGKNPTNDMFWNTPTMPTEPSAPPPLLGGVGSTTDMYSGEATTPPPAGQGELNFQPEAPPIDLMTQQLPLNPMAGNHEIVQTDPQLAKQAQSTLAQTQADEQQHHEEDILARFLTQNQPAPPPVVANKPMQQVETTGSRAWVYNQIKPTIRTAPRAAILTDKILAATTPEQQSELTDMLANKGTPEQGAAVAKVLDVLYPQQSTQGVNPNETQENANPTSSASDTSGQIGQQPSDQTVQTKLPGDGTQTNQEIQKQVLAPIPELSPARSKAARPPAPPNSNKVTQADFGHSEEGKTAWAHHQAILAQPLPQKRIHDINALKHYITENNVQPKVRAATERALIEHGVIEPAKPPPPPSTRSFPNTGTEKVDPQWADIQQHLTDANGLGEVLDSLATHSSLTLPELALTKKLAAISRVREAKLIRSDTANGTTLGKYNLAAHIVSIYRGAGTHTILHEASHAALAYKLITDGAFRDHVRGLLEDTKTYLRSKGLSDADMDKVYGLRNEHEFLSEALSSYKFQDLLRLVPSRIAGKASKLSTAWRNFVTAVRSALNIPDGQTSMLDDVLQAAGEALDSNLGTDTQLSVKDAELSNQMRKDERAARASNAAEPNIGAGEFAAMSSYNDTMNILADKGSELPTKMVDYVMRNLSTLGQFADVAKKYIPSAETYDKAVRRMQAAANEAVNAAAPIVTNWGELNKVDTAELHSIIRTAESSGFRPDLPITHTVNAAAMQDEQYNSEDHARAAYDALVNQFKASPHLQEIYSAQANQSTARIKDVIDGMRENIRRIIHDPTDRTAMLAQLNSKYAMAEAGRPYIPHRLYGDYIVVVTDDQGGREVWGYATQREAKRMAAEHEARFQNNATSKIIKGTEQFSSLDGTDRSFINKIQQAIDKTVTNQEDAKKLGDAMREIYVAALPEISGAKRLMPRKGIEGYSENFRRAWSEAAVTMPRYAAKLRHMDALRDSMEDAGREAGRDKTVYAVATWHKNKDSVVDFTTKFFTTATEKSAYINGLGKTDNYHIAIAHHGEIVDRVKSLLHTYLPEVDVQAQITKLQPQFDKMNAMEIKAYASNEVQATRYYNHLKARYNAFLEFHPQSPVAAALTNLGFLNFLGWTPSFPFMNLMQVPTLTLPRLAAKYGFGSSTTALRNAYSIMGKNTDLLSKLALNAWTKSGVDTLNIADFKGANENQLRLLRYMLDHGKLTFTQALELHAVTSGSSEAAQRIMKSAGWLAHPSEVLNRVVTALAAYDLAASRSNALSPEARHQYAIDMAVEALDTTQFDYSPENRPLILNHPLARVLLQFRQFSQQAAWQIGKAAYQGLKSLDPEVRREQRAYLAYILASSFVYAGARGAPAAGLIMMLASMLGGDGDDPEFEFRKWAKDHMGETLGPVFTNGMFGGLGMDVSRTIGLGDIIPGTAGQVQVAANRKDKIKDMLFDAGGPAVAMAGSVGTAMDWFDKGDVLQGWENLSPKAIRTALKAYRFSDRGLENSNGIVRLAGEEFTPWDIIVTAMGLNTERASYIQGEVGAVQGMDRMLGLQSGLLRKQYWMAKDNEDSDALATVEMNIQKFNDAHPELAITPKSVAGVARLKLKAQQIADRTGGVATTRTQEKLIEALGLETND